MQDEALVNQAKEIASQQIPEIQEIKPIQEKLKPPTQTKEQFIDNMAKDVSKAEGQRSKPFKLWERLQWDDEYLKKYKQYCESTGTEPIPGILDTLEDTYHQAMLKKEKSLKRSLTTQESRQLYKDLPPQSDLEKSVSYNFDTIVNGILQHEGLVKGQTPFRYTSPRMRKWNMIHGFEIDKISPKPANRINFIFLKNPAEVPMAVKKRFENYTNAPHKYGLSSKPTLEEAIRVFDQTGADDKIKYLKQRTPSLNMQQPLKNFFAS